MKYVHDEILPMTAFELLTEATDLPTESQSLPVSSLGYSFLTFRSHFVWDQF